MMYARHISMPTMNIWIHCLSHQMEECGIMSTTDQEHSTANPSTRGKMKRKFSLEHESSCSPAMMISIK